MAATGVLVAPLLLLLDPLAGRLYLEQMSIVVIPLLVVVRRWCHRKQVQV